MKKKIYFSNLCSNVKLTYNIICHVLLLTYILDRSSPDFKYWSGKSRSSKKEYQTVDLYRPKKTGPNRYEEINLWDFI